MVPVAYQNVGRRLGKETAQFRLAATDRQIEHLGSEDDARRRTREAQVIGEHDPVVVGVLRLGAAQLHRQQGNAPSHQPAGQPVQQHPVGEVAERPGRLGVALAQHHFGKTLATDQLAAQVLQTQAEKFQRMHQRLLQRRLLHATAAEKDEAARAQASRVHAEEFVVEAPRQAQPELRVVAHVHAPIGVSQAAGFETDLFQQLLGGQPRLQEAAQRLDHKPHADTVAAGGDRLVSLQLRLGDHAARVPPSMPAMIGQAAASVSPRLTSSRA